MRISNLDRTQQKMCVKSHAQDATAPKSDSSLLTHCQDEIQACESITVHVFISRKSFKRDLSVIRALLKGYDF